MEIQLEVWGDLACFCPPQQKVERLTYPFPTPSAARGILSSIYCKPREFKWVVTRIEVLEPIRYISFKRNEVKGKTSNKPIYTDEERTQRMTVALRDVRYRLTARIVPREAFGDCASRFYEQALRRIRTGKAYMQPGLGMREMIGYFEESDGARAPIAEDLDAGLMVYDIFDPDNPSVQKKAKTRLALFHAVMRQGIVEIPPYDSPQVIKGGISC